MVDSWPDPCPLQESLGRSQKPFHTWRLACPMIGHNGRGFIGCVDVWQTHRDHPTREHLGRSVRFVQNHSGHVIQNLIYLQGKNQPSPTGARMCTWGCWWSFGFWSTLQETKLYHVKLPPSCSLQDEVAMTTEQLPDWGSTDWVCSWVLMPHTGNRLDRQSTLWLFNAACI